MSAYLCNEKHIAALAAFAAVHDSAFHGLLTGSKDKEDTAASVAEGLATANIKSLQARYGGEDSAELKMFVNNCKQYAKEYVLAFPYLEPIDIIRMCGCYDYQSCEVDDWEGSNANIQITWIKNQAVSMFPGYENAIRDYTGDRDRKETGKVINLMSLCKK